MSLKHLLVHVDGSPRAAERVDLAVHLARKHGARLTGLFAESESLGPSIVARRSPEQFARSRGAARSLFEDRTKAAALDAEFWEIDRGEYSHLVTWTVVCCRYVDLALFGQPEEGERRLPDDLIEQVLHHAGRPILVVPSVSHFPEVGRRVLVAWTGSRESTRALHDAIPLMKGAESVTVLALQEPPSEAGGPALPPVNVIDHLAAHGIDAKYYPFILEEPAIVDAVLNRACESAADLTVMGGYEQKGFPFLQRTGNTRDILRTMTTPVLLSY